MVHSCCGSTHWRPVRGEAAGATPGDSSDRPERRRPARCSRSRCGAVHTGSLQLVHVRSRRAVLGVAAGLRAAHP